MPAAAPSAPAPARPQSAPPESVASESVASGPEDLADRLTHPHLDAAGIVHGFFTRRGGSSTGIHAGLNCGPGSDDNAAAVAENRRRASARLGDPAPALLTLHQVHSSDVVIVGPDTTLWHDSNRPRADALVTTRRDIALGVLAADCGPILFADPDAGVVGAAHSGWKGALADIGAATVAAMETLGGRRDRIAAVLGPCIGPDSYEVGPGFPDRFTATDPAAERFFQPSGRAGHFRFDLPGFILSRLGRLGLRSATALGLDTYADPDRFFSYRRATHRGEPDYGRLLSAIRLLPG